MSLHADREQVRIFMLRVWSPVQGAGAAEWHGKVQSLPDGEAYYFRDWEGLRRHLQSMLAVDDFKRLDTQARKGDEV
jgi:hypothetical protein